MIHVIILPSIIDNGVVSGIIRQYIPELSNDPNWKWIGDMEWDELNGVLLNNEHHINLGISGTIYRILRPGDIIILKDGKYVY